jgi:hypothetical protein
MNFHEVFLGSQHKIWSKQHNGKVRSTRPVVFDKEYRCVMGTR